MSDDVFQQPQTREEDPGVKFDRYGRYLLPDPETGKVQPYTRATTVTKTLSDTFALSQWGERMAVKGVGLRRDLYALAASTPLADKDTLNSVVKQAKGAAESSSGANLGSALHAFTEALDRDENPNVPHEWRGHVELYAEVMGRTEFEVIPEFIERIVVLPELGIAGKLDRLAYWSGNIIVADLKTAKRVDYSGGEIAMQLALYANAPLTWNPVTRDYEEMPAVNRGRAAVIHLPAARDPGEEECGVYWSDIEAGWEAVHHAMWVREWRKRKNLLVPMALPPRVVQRPPTYLEAIAAATCRADLSAVWRLANGRGEWTAELHAVAEERLAALDSAPVG